MIQDHLAHPIGQKLLVVYTLTLKKLVGTAAEELLHLPHLVNSTGGLDISEVVNLYDEESVQ